MMQSMMSTALNVDGVATSVLTVKQTLRIRANSKVGVLNRIGVSIASSLAIPLSMLGTLEFAKGQYIGCAIFIAVAMFSEFCYVYFKPYWSKSN